MRNLPRHKNTAVFLLANMIYADGMVALFAFGGIYAAGTFGWGTIQIGIFGILLNITATIGAYLGGKLDDRLGPKPVILGSLTILMLCVIAFLSIGRDHVLFVVPAAPPVPGAALFSALGEKLYVCIGLVIGFVVGPAQAASRTLLVRLAPADRMTQFFGLFALSGKVTSFMGPLLVAIVTTAFVSQKAGMAVLVGVLRGRRADLEPGQSVDGSLRNRSLDHAQCRKCRVPVNTIAMPCSSAALITSSSRIEPPGWITAVAPASIATSSPSANGKNASEATTEPLVSGAGSFSSFAASSALRAAMRAESTRLICPAPMPTVARSLA